MIAALVKRDPAFRLMWTISVPAAMIIAVFTPNALLQLPLQIGLLASLSMPARTHARASRFDLGLPIAGRDLFVSRLLSFLAIAWMPVAAIFLANALRGRSPEHAMKMLEVAMIVTAALLVPLAYKLPEAQISIGKARGITFGVALFGAAAIFALPALATITVFGAVSLLSMVIAWPEVPASFEIAPRRYAPASGLATATGQSGALAAQSTAPAARFSLSAFTPRSWTPWMPLLRIAFTGYMPIFWFLLMIMQGVFGAWMYFFCIFAVQAVSNARARAGWLLTLPFSHRQRMHAVLLGSIVPLFVGVVIGVWAGAPVRSDMSIAQGPREEYRTDVNVALEYWRYAANHNVPMIDTPWGPIHPKTFSALGFTFYNPYTVEGNNLPFYNWQMKRARDAVYGSEVGDEHPMPTTDQPRTRILALGLALAVGLFVALIVEVSAWHFLQRWSAKTRHWTIFGLMSPLIGALVLDIALKIHFHVSLGGALLNAAILRLSAMLPDNLAIVFLVACIPAVILYFLLDWQFRRGEISSKLQTQAAFGTIRGWS